jgi:exopolysaccharide biosynthesis polyprenyl glycosylphosphotransferase
MASSASLNTTTLLARLLNQVKLGSGKRQSPPSTPPEKAATQGAATVGFGLADTLPDQSRTIAEPGSYVEVEALGKAVTSRVRRLKPSTSVTLDQPIARTLCWAAADWTATFAATCLAESLLAAVHVAPLTPAGLAMAAGLATLVAPAAHVFGGDRRLEGPCRVEAFTAVVKAGTFAPILMLLASALLGLGVSKLALLLGYPMVLAAVVAGRVIFRRFADRFAPIAQGKPVLIYGTGPTARRVAQQLLLERGLGLAPVGFIDDSFEDMGEVRIGPGMGGERLGVLGGRADLDMVLSATGAQAVFLCVAQQDQARKVAEHLDSRKIQWFLVPNLGTDHPIQALHASKLGELPLFTPRRPEASRAYDVAKRALDVFGSLFLLVATSPLLAISALLVKLTSPGEVVFTQRRVGLDGELFTIYKLRTMFTSAPRYGFHPEKSTDNRITPVGRWLRKLSLDELPQLVNILLGQMSFVGPRPEMPFIVARYDNTQLQRITVKPGLTGLWQISPDRAFKIHENIHYDLYYVERRSLLMDVAIMLVTPFVLLAEHCGK